MLQSLATIEEINTLDCSPAKSSMSLSSKIFLAAVVIGFLLRLIAVIWGDIDPGGDGVGRMVASVGWAEHPSWQGLTGIWPFLHFYFLGSLIRIWDQPIVLAKLVNLAFGMGAIFALRSAVRPIFGEMVASLSALLLAIYWTHIWLTSSYWVEIPYLLLIFLAARHAFKTRETADWKSALLSGVFLSLAILLRHEAMLLLGVFLIWYGLNVKNRKAVLLFAAVPALAAAWNFIEPWLKGHSYFEYAAAVAQMKAGESLAQGITIRDSVIQWVMMPAAVPSLLVVIAGLWGLWKARRIVSRDLFAWMFIAQVGLALFMTFAFGWRPQLRYLLLYFVNLLPYTALVWEQLMRRFPARKVLVALVASTMLLQSAAWWSGRNGMRSMGWLPLRVITSSQKALDDWIEANDQTQARIVTIVGAGSFTEPWSIEHSYLVNHIAPRSVHSQEINVGYEKEILNGDLPPSVYAADMVLLDPQAAFYPKVLAALRAKEPGTTVEQIHPNIAVLASRQRRQN